MRTARLLTAAVSAVTALVAGSIAFAAPSSAAPASVPRHYLSLGDSLAAGFQTLPAGGYETGHGYANIIANKLTAQAAASGQPFDFTNLGCPGETTGTMLNGGCPYPHTFTGSQLSNAEAYLHAHSADSTVVTISIGANDVDGCAQGGSVNVGCALAGIGIVKSDLDTIMSRLKAAAGPNVRFIGTNLYNPFLAMYLSSFMGRFIAPITLPLQATLNNTIADDYQKYNVPTADTAEAFGAYNVLFLPDIYNGMIVPHNVGRIMSWTNMARNDIHCNDAGYQVMADAYLKLF